MATNKQGGSGANNVPMWRVLLIAPDSGLQHAADETQRIINALRPEVLLGEVTTTDVLDRIAAGTFDIVWFLGHSGPDGLQLTDGVLSPAHLTQILRQSPPSLVVLNSCSSIHTAMQVHDDLQTAVICTVLDVPDIDAYITGAALAGALAQGLDTTEAYQRSRPASNRQYVMLNDSVRLNGVNELDDVHRLIMATASDLQQEMSGMLHEVVQTARTVETIKRDVADMRTEQQRVRVELSAQPDRYAATLTRKRALSWGAGFVLFLAAYAVIEFREMFAIPVWVALLFSAFVAGVAAWLFVYGIGFRLDR